MRGSWICILVTLLAAGCSTVRPYRESYPNNLTFSSPGLKGSVLSSAEVSLNIFLADDACEMMYQGSVILHPGDGPRQIGLPTGRDVYARIWIETHSWLENGTKTRSHEFRFRPRSDYQYEVEYIHKKKAYGKSLTQTNTRTGEATQMRVEDWDACKK
jgi:hypothetical protein